MLRGHQIPDTKVKGTPALKIVRIDAKGLSDFRNQSEHKSVSTVEV